MPTHFVPTEEVRRLTMDSYEHLATLLDSAVLESKATLFPDSTPNSVERVGTFSDHVLVASDDGRFLKVMFERQGNKVVLGESEPVPVPVYTDDNLEHFLTKEANIAVEQILGGLSNEALGQIRTFFPFVPDHASYVAERSLQAAVDGISADRPWKRLYRERSEAIAETVDVTDVPKFEQFGEAPEGMPPEEFRAKVVEGLESLTGRLSDHLQLLDSVDDFKAMSKKAENKDDADVLLTFSSFVEDLKQDIQSVYDLALESLQAVKSVGALVKLNDALASELKDYEVASRFVSKMAETLRSSN